MQFLRRKASYFLAFLPLREDYDNVENYFLERKRLTGRQRLRIMFSVDEFGNLSEELVSVLQATYIGLFAGAFYGGFIKSRKAFHDFLDNNHATQFYNHLEAKRQLQTQVSLGFARGAFSWGWRMGLFCSSYMFISTTICVYRGETSIVEYTAAGVITGTMLKFLQGPRSALVGGLLGGFLGTVAGCLSLLILKISGMTMEDLRSFQYELKTIRDKKIVETIKLYRDQEVAEILEPHDEKIATESVTEEETKNILARIETKDEESVVAK